MKNLLHVLVFNCALLALNNAMYSYDVLGKCKFLPDGIYPLARCSQWYVMCSGKNGLIRKCPSDLYYDSAKKRCDTKQNIATCSEFVSTTTTPVSDITSRVPSFDCMGFLPGDYPLRPNACVPQYFTCDADGIGMVRSCPNELYFDPIKKVCNFYANIVACGGTTTPSTMTTTQTVPTLPHVNFDCSFRPDGYYSNPVAPCSNIYYSCVDGEARENHCEAGLVYDALSAACQSPMDTYACTGRTTVATTQTTGGTTPLLPIDCITLQNGMYVNPLQPCSNIFYMCSDGLAEKFYCPKGLYFDPATQKCQRFEDTFICTGRTTTTSTPTPTTQTTPMSDVPFDCTNRADGDYPNPSQPCSTFYYVCSGSVASVQECPQGLYFDPEKIECNSFSNIFVCSGIRTTSTTIISSPTVTSAPEVDCWLLGNGLFPNPLSPCSQIYYYCSNGFAYRRQCQDGLFFNPELKICDHFSNIFVCTGTRSTTTTTLMTTTSPFSSPPFDCGYLPNGNYPNPISQCSQTYYTCSNGKATQRRCPANTFFDTEMEVCLDFDNVPTCSGQTRTVTTSSTSTTPMSDITTPFYNCSGKSNDNYPLGPCEKTYVSCVDGEPILRQCPPNLYYDYTINECDYVYYIPSCGGQRTTTPMSDVTSQTTTTPKPEFDCSQLPDGKYANPNSHCLSRFYYVCTGGATIKMYCPSNLVYDPYLQECRYLRNACHWRPPYNGQNR